MRSFTNLALLAAIPLIAAGIAAPQSQSKYEQRTLEINGHTGQAMVYEIDGKSYVDLESLARIANGSLSFRGGSIILHLPAAGAASSQAHEHPSSPGMTNDFMKASLQVLATLKEWTHTLADEIQRGVPGSGSHLADFHKRAADQLRVATVDVKNDIGRRRTSSRDESLPPGRQLEQQARGREKKNGYGKVLHASKLP